MNGKMRMAQGMKKDAISMDTVKRLLSYVFRKHKIVLFVVAICIIVNSLTDVYSNLFIKSLIDDYITPLLNDPVKDYLPLIKGITGLSIILLIGVVAMYLYSRLMVIVSQNVLKDIRDEMFEKMERLPIKYFDTNSHGDIMSHYTNDTDTLRQMISQSLPNLLSCIISIVSTFISMLYLNYLLTLIVLLCTILSLVLTAGIAKKSGDYFVANQESLGKLNGYIEEMIDGQKVIKVFTHEEEAKEGFDKLNDELCDNSTKANIYANILMPFMGNMGTLTYVIVCICGGLISIFHPFGLAMTIGTIASFLTLTKNFSQPVSRVSQQFNFVVMALSGATRIFKLMDETPEENNGKVELVNIFKEKDKIIEVNNETGLWAWKKPNGELIELKGDVRFKDVTFGYNEKKVVLHNVSLYAKPGQKIAFVGSTGAGKTTITNLINRFYDINEGTITYDGIDIKDINKIDLRQSLGMVLQDTNLFTGTIMDNIRYGKEDATDEECIKAAELANADDFINLLPDGYNTVLTNNGASLSQGERQLLSIARAALSNPPVMILDEATSSIDTRTEKIVQEGMDMLMDGRTVFVIAHRLSTIQNAKAIMVLEKGKIIERGNHEDLMKEKGEYYELYTGGLELD